MRSQYLPGENRRQWNSYFLLIAASVLLLLWVVGPITLLCAYALHRVELDWKRKIQIAGLGLLVFGLSLTTITVNPFEDFASYWFVAVPTFGLVRYLYMCAKLLRPQSMEEMLEARRKKLGRDVERAHSQATKRRRPQDEQEKINLGAVIDGGNFGRNNGLFIDKRHCYLPNNLLSQHMLVLGATGAGKTQTLISLIHEVFKNTDRDVFVVDGKGDLETFAPAIRQMAYHYRGEIAPVFKIGHSEGGAVFDGFQGSGETVYNRLCALAGTHRAEGDSEYYANISRTIFGAMCLTTNEPPRSFSEVIERIDQAWLTENTKGNPVIHKTLQQLSPEMFQGVLVRLLPYFMAFDKSINPSGFNLTDTKCAIFSLRTQAAGDMASNFLAFMAEVFKAYTGSPEQNRAGLLVVDEFGQFTGDATGISNLLSLGRAADMSTVLATQTLASMQSIEAAQRILGVTNTKILMKTEHPDDLLPYFGTRTAPANTVQHNEGEMTGSGTWKFHQEIPIDPNSVPRLSQGEAFVVRNREFARVQGAMVDLSQFADVPPQEDETIQTAQQAQNTEPTAAASDEPPNGNLSPHGDVIDEASDFWSDT